MTNRPSLFEEMFQRAERFSLEEFTDVDVKDEGIWIPEISEEGFIKAVAGDIVRVYTDAYKEVKGWFLGIESKRRYIDESCRDTIEWLKDEDRDNPRLSLDMGSFATWMKSSETFLWRYYFVLNDQIFKEIVEAAKKENITAIETLADFDLKERMKVTRLLDSAKTIMDLVVIVEKYRSRCDLIFSLLLKRKRKIQNFPFQVMLLGYADLNRTVKKIVNLAT